MIADRRRPATEASEHGLDAQLARALREEARIGVVRALAGAAGGLPLTALAGQLGIEVALARRQVRALARLGAVDVSGADGEERAILADTPLGSVLREMFSRASRVAEPQVSLGEAEQSGSQMTLDAVLQQLATGVAIYDEHGELMRMNEAAERLTRRRVEPGESAEDRQRRYAMRQADGSPMTEVESPSGRARRGETFLNLECIVDGMHGQNTHLLTSGVPLLDEHGRRRGAIVVFQDVTEQRRLVQETERQRSLAEAIIDHAPEAIGLWDATDDFRCLRTNAAYLKLLRPEDRERGSIAGIKLGDFFEGETRRRVLDTFERARATGQPVTLDEFPLTFPPNTEIRWYRWSLTPLSGADGKVETLLVSAVEITELVRARESLRYEAARLHAVIAAMPEAVALADERGRFQLTNAAAEELWGRSTPAEIETTEYADVFECVTPEGQPLQSEELPLPRALAGETVIGQELIYLQPNGRRISLLCNAAPVYEPETQAFLGGVVVFQDVTEQRRLERDEARQRALAEGIVAGAPVGIALYDATDEFRCVRHNAEFLALTGPEFRQRGTIVGIPLNDLFGEDSRARVREIYERVRETGAPLTIDEFPAMLQPESEPRWYRWSLTPLRDEHGTIAALLNSAIEITELVRSREQSRRHAATLQAVIKAMPEAVAVTDPLGRLLLNNAAAEALWGPVSSDRTGPRGPVFVGEAHTPEGAPLRESDLPLERAQAGETLIGLEIVLGEYSAEQRSLLCSAAPVFMEETGQRLGSVLICQDITQMKALERQRDDFLSIAAHELRTPLTSILGTLHVMHKQLERAIEGAAIDTPTLLRAVTRISGQAQRINKLVGDLLDTTRIYGGQLPLTLEPTNFGALVHGAVADKLVAYPRRAIPVTLPEGELVVQGDATRLMQVLDNLLTNALKYSTEDQPVEALVVVEGSSLHLAITDHGPGIAPEYQGELFQRFYRVPGVQVRTGSGVGLGLGLYITRTIVERHGGQVWVESAPGLGSTFHVRLPLAVASS